MRKILDVLHLTHVFEENLNEKVIKGRVDSICVNIITAFIKMIKSNTFIQLCCSHCLLKM